MATVKETHEFIVRNKATILKELEEKVAIVEDSIFEIQITEFYEDLKKLKKGLDSLLKNFNETHNENVIIASIGTLQDPITNTKSTLLILKNLV